MMLMKRVGKKLTWVRGPSEGYLEVKVREDASPADLTNIVQALATISNFFGARLDNGGSGSGGSGLVRDNRTLNLKFGLPGAVDRALDSPEHIVPPGPSIGSDSRIGWRQ